MSLLEIDGIKQREISEKVQFPGYAVTRSLDILEKEGFIIRDKCQESRRCFAIRLTKKGHQLRPTLINTVEIVNDILLKNLTPDESTFFDRVLTKLLPRC